jgi:hypothetical protein
LEILVSPRFQLNDMNRMWKSGLIIAVLPTADLSSILFFPHMCDWIIQEFFVL